MLSSTFVVLIGLLIVYLLCYVSRIYLDSKAEVKRSYGGFRKFALGGSG